MWWDGAEGFRLHGVLLGNTWRRAALCTSPAGRHAHGRSGCGLQQQRRQSLLPWHPLSRLSNPGPRPPRLTLQKLHAVAFLVDAGGRGRAITLHHRIVVPQPSQLIGTQAPAGDVVCRDDEKARELKIGGGPREVGPHARAPHASWRCRGGKQATQEHVPGPRQAGVAVPHSDPLPPLNKDRPPSTSSPPCSPCARLSSSSLASPASPSASSASQMPRGPASASSAMRCRP